MEEELIPKEFWAALDHQPDDFVLRAAIVDALLERGDEEAAECIRWSLEKRRVPNGSAWCIANVRDGSDIPEILWEAGGFGGPYWLFSPINPTTSLRRLVWRWRHTTAEQRAAFWEWQPADPHPTQ